MGLLARYLELQGIPTTSLSVSRGLTRGVLPPRSLIATDPRGQTVGPPGDAVTQRRRLLAALALLHDAKEGGVLVELAERGKA